ncbi:MAG: GntR family transcriptional regulator [bacterium]
MSREDYNDWIETLSPLQGRTRSTLSEHVYQALMEAILQGRLGPGEHLVEQALADRFGVSRMAVREAIRKLAHDGLVEVIPNRGTFTIEFTNRDIEEIYDLRAILEEKAVRRVTARRRRSDLALLEDVIDEMRRVEQMEEEDRVAAATVDTRFHQRLVELSEHSRLIRVWRSMSAQITMVVYNSSSYYPDIGDLAERHQKIVEAMRSGDPDLAADTVLHHIHEGGKYLLAAIKQDQELARG